MELQKTKDISYALKTIEGHFPAAFRPVAASPRQAEPQATGYRQVRIDPLTNPVLLGYLKERGILPEIAREACKEVHFQNKGKWYFAVGFANRSGGYEIRNKYLKGSISPKEITHIKNGSDRCIVVEGFMDYLSYLTLKATHPGNGQPKGNGPDYIVLNSVSNVGKAIPVLKESKSALCLLDNDSAGRQAIKKRVKSLLEGIWLSFYCYPATTGYLFLIISDQQFIDRFSFLGYGTDGTEDADSLDMETGIEVVEEGVLRVLLPGIGVGKHSFGTGFTYSLAEICQVDLLFISEVLWHVGGAGVTLIDRLIRRVKIK